MHIFPASRLLFNYLKIVRGPKIRQAVQLSRVNLALQRSISPWTRSLTSDRPKTLYHWAKWDNRTPVAVVHPEAGVVAIVAGGGQIWDDRSGVDKRARTEATQESSKRRKLENGDEKIPIYITQFSKEEIEAEARKPKKKVAVMLGYAGSGYKGMQINNDEKTIEGDLFKALVAAGAISKANADDPKKSSFVRCARTDRGVHAAGNIISLKMIVEDPDIVEKINEHLPSQIRVWGFEQAKGSFSSYQLCDARIYEYLIPTYCFLPPHPQSFLGKELVSLANEAEDLAGYEERQKEVSNFWAETEEKVVKPFLDTLDPKVSAEVHRALYNEQPMMLDTKPIVELPSVSQVTTSKITGSSRDVPATAEIFSTPISNLEPANESEGMSSQPDSGIGPDGEVVAKGTNATETDQRPPLSALEDALKQLKNIIVAAKRAYRIPPSRLARIQSVLNNYLGTHNFHNYTIGKLPRDPSAKRVIKSFTAGPEPILINNTEWLSLKVHGQSFMMHQIRKMVTMAAYIVRCGCPEERIKESYDQEKFTIPKAPSLGLLLERPVFETYNRDIKREKEKSEIERGRIGFEKFEKEVEEFKQREIYGRIFMEEESNDTRPARINSEDFSFHSFFASLDGVRRPDLLYLSSKGISAAKRELPANSKAGVKTEKAVGVESDEDSDGPNQQDG
ncbi:MAG: hypothetical protein Q9184_003875 [Pyrenodesmia sp. 2 TL-2023]